MNLFLRRIACSILFQNLVFFFLFLSFAPNSIQAQSRESHISRLSLPVASNVRVVIKKGAAEEKVILTQDYLSSTKQIIKEDGSIVEQPSYYPYGTFYPDTPGVKDARTPGVNDNNRYYYTNQRKVTNDSNLYNYNARYYNPDLGIFIQPDTVEGGNRFSYVGGNPVMNNDPTGERYETQPGGGGSGTPSWYLRREKEFPNLLTYLDYEAGEAGLWSMGALADQVFDTVTGIGYNPNNSWFASHQESLEPYHLKDQNGNRLLAGAVEVGGLRGGIRASTSEQLDVMAQYTAYARSNPLKVRGEAIYQDLLHGRSSTVPGADTRFMILDDMIIDTDKGRRAVAIEKLEKLAELHPNTRPALANQKYVFSQTEDGLTVISTHGEPRSPHSALIGGRPAAVAGEIKFKDGMVEWVNTNSGHYHGEPWRLAAIYQALAEAGVGFAPGARSMVSHEFWLKPLSEGKVHLPPISK